MPLFECILLFYVDLEKTDSALKPRVNRSLVCLKGVFVWVSHVAAADMRSVSLVQIHPGFFKPRYNPGLVHALIPDQVQIKSGAAPESASRLSAQSIRQMCLGLGLKLREVPLLSVLFRTTPLYCI